MKRREGTYSLRQLSTLVKLGWRKIWIWKDIEWLYCLFRADSRSLELAELVFRNLQRERVFARTGVFSAVHTYHLVSKVPRYGGVIYMIFVLSVLRPIVVSEHIILCISIAVTVDLQLKAGKLKPALSSRHTFGL
jgi:hypothetical protein